MNNYEKLSLTQLRVLIMAASVRVNMYSPVYKTHSEEKLDDLLRARQRKLNAAFEWTPENCEKLLYLNQQLIECWEMLHEEARQTFDTIKKRINASDKFLTDFDIDARITFHLTDVEENDIGEILEDSIPELGVNHYSYNREACFDENLYLDRNHNWNHDHWFKGKFDDYFISQAIHDLYDHTLLSFCDILKIDELWGEVKVDYQHCRKLKKKF